MRTAKRPNNGAGGFVCVPVVNHKGRERHGSSPWGENSSDGFLLDQTTNDNKKHGGGTFLK